MNPRFVSRGVLTEDVICPTIVYLHASGLTSGAFTNYNEAMNYIPFLLKGKSFDKVNYLIALLWGKDGARNADLFVFSDINMKDWPGNPEVHSRVFNEYEIQSSGAISCGDGLILLGREEEHRRQCASIDDYLSRRPLILKSDGKRILEQ